MGVADANIAATSRDCGTRDTAKPRGGYLDKKICSSTTARIPIEIPTEIAKMTRFRLAAWLSPSLAALVVTAGFGTVARDWLDEPGSALMLRPSDGLRRVAGGFGTDGVPACGVAFLTGGIGSCPDGPSLAPGG